MESVEQFVDKLSSFARLVADNVDRDLVLASVAVGVVMLLLLVIALRTTVYRNFDRRAMVTVATRVEKIEEQMEQLRADVQQALKELHGLAEDLKREFGEEGGPGGAPSGGTPAAGGGERGGPQGGGGRSVSAAPQQVNPAPRVEALAPRVEAIVPRAEAIVPPAEAPAPGVSPIVRGMEKSRVGFLSRLKGLFAGRKSVSAAALEDLEELLILSDVGARCASDLVERAREAAKASGELEEEQLKDLLRAGVQSQLITVPENHRIYAPPSGSPQVMLVVGVNGAGKTTTVAKLAARYQKQGKRVLVIAADTFRAAAVQQLEEWSRRIGFTLVKGPENAKPGAVVFDGMVAAKESGADVVLIDTAGRLHTKANLMQELEGVRNSIRKHVPDAPHETVLVLDGVSGQNALAQAREFNGAVPLTGIVVTKLDGTPKGGIIVAISQELKVPVFYVGVGERAEDLIPFSPEQFVEALFSEADRGPGRESAWAGAKSEAGADGVVIN